MADQMTSWERVRAALHGQDVDRLPVSMWRHFFFEETSAESLANALLGFQHRFGWDFMKVNPRASYHVEGWGAKLKYHGDNPPTVTDVPVKAPDDWLRLEVLDPDKGVLGEQLTALDLIARGLKGETPFLMTVFTPLSIAGRLVKSEAVLLEHLREHPDKVQHALDVITETFTRFSTACLERGACGLFYATTAWASADKLSEDEYRRFARPWDLKLLEALPAAEFHVLHVCRHRNLLHVLSDYPVHAFSWDARGEGNPSLSEGKRLVGGRAVIGGMAQDKRLVEATPEQLACEIAGMRVALGNRGWMLGPACTFRPETPEANLRAIRSAVG